MEATLLAEKRESKGKNEARRLRAAGRIPGVLYGARSEGRTPEGTSVAVDPREVMRILRSESGVNTLINFKLGDSERRVMVRDYQIDPITSRLLHADFYALAMDRALQVAVPIVLKGESQGVKLHGGLLDFITRELQVECLPADIPEHIDIDVSDLGLHQAVRVRDLPVNPKWKPVTDADTMIVHVVVPRAEEAAAAPEAGAAAAGSEPEVIKKGKTDKDEEPAKK
jgi:large subunit ribosomal protein L25